MDMPLDAFSMIALVVRKCQAFLGATRLVSQCTYRSMMVIIGQIRAPATAALAASAANRSPKLRVFHWLFEFTWIPGMDESPAGASRDMADMTQFSTKRKERGRDVRKA